MRHNARKYALQALYQWMISGNDINEIEIQFLKEFNFSKVDIEYFRGLLHGVPTQLDELDAAMEPFLSRPASRLTPIELTVLRMAIFELLNYKDIPYQVIINEALELNKKFGAQDGFKFVNGVLDKAAHKIRADSDT